MKNQQNTLAITKSNHSQSHSKHLIARVCAVMMMTGLVPNANALDLEGAFLQGFENDPSFQSARAEKENNRSQAYAGWSAYIPTYTWAQQQMATDISTRRIETLSVPIVDGGKAGQFAGANSKFQYANQTYLTRVQDLATRTLKAVNQWILANEALKNNQSRIALLEGQLKGVQKKYELGEGTVTDLRDIEVKFNMAKADDLSLQVQKKVAGRQIAAITGTAPAQVDFILPNIHGKHPMPDVGDVLERVKAANPSVNVARENANIAKYNIVTQVGQAIPSVYYTNLKTQYTGQTTTNNGITVNFPIAVGGYVQTYASVKQYSMADSQRQDVEAKTELEAERLVSVSQVGQQVLDIKKAAVDSAKLSVEANQKSFSAGVRSTTDVLNSIQMLFQAKNDYAVAVTQQAENYLNLLLIQADDPAQAIKQVQTFMFNR